MDSGEALIHYRFAGRHQKCEDDAEKGEAGQHKEDCVDRQPGCDKKTTN